MNRDSPVGFRATRVDKASDHGGVQKRYRHCNDLPAECRDLRTHRPEMGARAGTPLTIADLSKRADDIRLEKGRGDAQHRRRRAFVSATRMAGYPLMSVQASGALTDHHLLEYITENVLVHDDRPGFHNRL